MIDNQLYKVLRLLIKIEDYYYQRIPIEKVLAAFSKARIPHNDIKGAIDALTADKYIVDADDDTKYIRISSKAHAEVEAKSRASMMFWVPVIISVIALIGSLFPIKELLKAIVEIISQQ